MKINTIGFSFIEIIIATSIISITVFGVYRLIGENTKIISNAGNYQQTMLLFPVLTQCIDNLNNNFLNTSIGSGLHIYLGDTGTGCANEESANVIDNIEYYLSGIITSTGVDFIEWDIYIDSDQIETQSGHYKQIK